MRIVGNLPRRQMKPIIKNKYNVCTIISQGTTSCLQNWTNPSGSAPFSTVFFNYSILQPNLSLTTSASHNVGFITYNLSCLSYFFSCFSFCFDLFASIPWTIELNTEFWTKLLRIRPANGLTSSIDVSQNSRQTFLMFEHHCLSRSSEGEWKRWKSSIFVPYAWWSERLKDNSNREMIWILIVWLTTDISNCTLNWQILFERISSQVSHEMWLNCPFTKISFVLFTVKVSRRTVLPQLIN